jgi:hypothetical protein
LVQCRKNNYCGSWLGVPKLNCLVDLPKAIRTKFRKHQKKLHAFIE